MLHVFIPIAEGQTVPQKVLQSIAAQTELSVVTVCCRPGLIDSEGVYNPQRLNGEIAAREAVRMAALGTRESVVMLQDSDVEHTCTDNFAMVLQEMRRHPEYTAMALTSNENPSPDHIPLHCLAIRVRALWGIRFRASGGECSCKAFARDVVRYGMYGYADTTQRLSIVSRN